MDKYIYQLETQICGQYRRYRVGVDKVVSIDKIYFPEIQEYVFGVDYEDGTRVDVTGPQMIVLWSPIETK